MRTPFEFAVREHGARVLRVCRALLDPVDAEDAWSETFLAALGAWEALPEGADVEAWLVTIAHRKAIDVTRRRARLPTPLSSLPDRAAPAPPEPEPELWQAVRELPERQRLAVAYRYLGGLSHAAIAELIGGTDVAVRRACADGIKTLRRRCPGEGGDR